MAHIWAIYTMAMLNNQRDPEAMSFYSPGLSTFRMCFLIFTAIGVQCTFFTSPGGTETYQTWGCFVAPAWWFGNGKHDNQGESHMICPKLIDSSWLTKSLSISREMVVFGGHLGIPQATWQSLQLARILPILLASIVVSKSVKFTEFQRCF